LPAISQVSKKVDVTSCFQDLAIDALEDLWFALASKSSSGQSSTSLSNVILNVVGAHQGRVPPIEEALRLIMAKHAEKGTEAPLDRLREVMENLIDSLVVESSSMVSIASLE
jgi:cohesin loading factor subunit SCC2